MRDCLAGADAVLHTATLHKPHVGSHGKQAFVDTNVTGTLALLEEAVAAGVGSFVFTSTTSAFGRAVTAGGEPAADHRGRVAPAAERLRRDQDRGGEPVRDCPPRARPAGDRLADRCCLPVARRLAYWLFCAQTVDDLCKTPDLSAHAEMLGIPAAGPAHKRA